MRDSQLYYLYAFCLIFKPIDGINVAVDCNVVIINFTSIGYLLPVGFVLAGTLKMPDCMITFL